MTSEEYGYGFAAALREARRASAMWPAVATTQTHTAASPNVTAPDLDNAVIQRGV